MSQHHTWLTLIWFDHPIHMIFSWHITTTSRIADKLGRHQHSTTCWTRIKQATDETRIAFKARGRMIQEMSLLPSLLHRTLNKAINDDMCLTSPSQTFESFFVHVQTFRVAFDWLTHWLIHWLTGNVFLFTWKLYKTM